MFEETLAAGSLHALMSGSRSTSIALVRWDSTRRLDGIGSLVVSHWLMAGANCRMDLGCYPLHAVLPARPYLRLLLLSQIFYRGA